MITDSKRRCGSKHSTRPILSGRGNRRKGAMLVFIAVGLVIFTVVMVFSVDIARMHLVRAELRSATDAAARAGAEMLSREQDTDKAVSQAIRIAGLNQVGGNSLILSESDIELGSAEPNGKGGFGFAAGGDPPNSVRVNSDPGNVRLFLGGMLGRSTFRPVMDAVALRMDRDVALVLDSSGSMRTANRFIGLTLAFNTFLDVLREDSVEDFVSLIDYDTRARLVQSITNDLNLLSTAFGLLRVGGRTAIGEGLLLGSDSLMANNARKHALKTIIVMTDGNQNQGISPIAAARIAVRRGHVIHTVTFGRGANQSLMRQVAVIGKGIHLHANNNRELIEAFREIASQLPVVLTE